MTNKKHSKYSLEELRRLSNEKILSKWSLLASFVRLNEYDEDDTENWGASWHKSREKAIQLLKSDKAEEYLDKARLTQTMDVNNYSIVNESVNEEFPQEDTTDKLNVYQENYKQLLQLIPSLEERIVYENSITALSNTIGYRGTLLLKPLQNSDGKADFQLYHFIEDGKQYRVETLFSIQVSVSKMEIEPLAYCNAEEIHTVYHKKSNYENELIDLKKQQLLNQLLADWLENLNKYKHRFIWEDEELFNNNLYGTLNHCKFNYRGQDIKDLESELEEIKEETKNVDSKTEFTINITEELIDKIENEKQLKIERKKQKKEDKKQQQQIALENFIETINDDIQDFEIGHIKLTLTHQRLGITQQNIDWINHYHKAMVFVPDRHSKNKVPGFQLLPTGKVLFGIS